MCLLIDRELCFKPIDRREVHQVQVGLHQAGMADDHIHPLSDPFLHPGLPPVRATVSGFSTAALTRGLLEREHSGMSILVTGCAGFIGSNVSSLLVESGHFVKGLDNIEPFASALARWRLGPVLRSDQFAYLQVDITDKERLFSVFSRNPETDPVDAVIHLAARAGVRASVEDPRSCYEINVLGTLNLLELCREFGVSRFILASTSSVYGDQGTGSCVRGCPEQPPAFSLRSLEERGGNPAPFLPPPARYGRRRAAVFHRLRAGWPPGHERVPVHPVHRGGRASHRVWGRYPAAGLHLRGRHSSGNYLSPEPQRIPDHQPW